MTIEEAAAHIQRMHATRTVSRDSIVAWYSFYQRQLPTMHPERSEVDLVRTVALWMRLTDEGGTPAFPSDYMSTLSFPEMHRAQGRLDRPSLALPFGGILLLAALVCLFVARSWALPLLLGGAAVLYLGYRVQGGATNPDLMVSGSTLYKQEGRRVVEWAQSHAPNL